MRHWLPALALMAAATLCGCASTADSISAFLQTGLWSTAAQAGKICARARELEAHGELTMALDHWRLVDRITANPAETSREIERLQSKIAKAADAHYHDGIAKLRKNKPVAARNRFLATLRLNPASRPALKQINGRFSPFPIAVYLATAGDNPTTVAKKVFGDKDKAFLVAWFNDLPKDQVLTPGTLLILPKLEKPPIKRVRKTSPTNQLAEAKALMVKNDLDGALALAGQADRKNPDVQALVHTIHLKQAEAQIASGRLESGRLSLDMVPDGFPGKPSAVEALHKQQTALILAKAQAHFEQGEYLQSLDMAERLAEEVPENIEVRDLANEARYCLALDHFDQKRFLEAREVLENTAQGHAASMALYKIVRVRLADQAQIHYRNGVKHFINEDLEAAIAEWELALACNPDQDKVRENIDNARRLMQKIKALP